MLNPFPFQQEFSWDRLSHSFHWTIITSDACINYTKTRETPSIKRHETINLRELGVQYKHYRFETHEFCSTNFNINI